MLLKRKQFLDYVVMLLLKLVDKCLVALIALRCTDTDLDERVSTSADGR